MRAERRLVQHLLQGLCAALALSPPLVMPAVAQEVAVDIGHTLKAHGAVSARGRGEFYFNRDLAHALVAALQAQGVRTRLINGDGRIGSLKAHELPRYKSPVALRLMHAIKDALDPQGIMNPGRVLA